MKTQKLFCALVMVALTLCQGEALGARRHKTKRGVSRITRTNRSDAGVAAVRQSSGSARRCRGGSCTLRSAGSRSRSSARTSVRSQRRLLRGARVAAVGIVRNQARRGGSSRTRNQRTAVRGNAQPQNVLRSQGPRVASTPVTSTSQLQRDHELALRMQEDELPGFAAAQDPVEIVRNAQEAPRLDALLGQLDFRGIPAPAPQQPGTPVDASELARNLEQRLIATQIASDLEMAQALETADNNG